MRLHGPDYCVTVKCCLFLHSDRGVLLLCSACLLDLCSFSLFSVLTVCSGPALGNTRSYKLLDWNSVTAGISSPFYCSHPKERWQLSEAKPQPIATYSSEISASCTDVGKLIARITKFSELPFSCLKSVWVFAELS